jgi:CDP-glycerol glycerophosphotransferase
VGAQVLRMRNTARRAALQAAALWRRHGPAVGRPLFVVGCFGERFDGNAFDFALYASRDRRVRVIAVAPNPAEADRLREHGIPAVEKRTFKEHLALQLADAVFTVGHLRSDFSVMPNSTALRVMLWHATPMKAVGRLNKPIPDPIDRFDIVTATSDLTAPIVRDAFASDVSELLVTGHPKTDRLLQPFDGSALRESLGLPAKARVISYLPTWRHDFAVEQAGDFGRNADPLLRTMEALTNDRAFGAMLERHNAVFVLKPHPYDDLSRLQALEDGAGGRIRSLAPHDVDTAELMRISDILVTDYSGALTDWLLLAKPLICFTYDYDHYWGNRGSPSFDFRAVFAELMIDTHDDLVRRLESFLSEPQLDSDVIDAVSRKMHRYRDGLASRRITNETLSRLRERRSLSGARAA